MPRPATGQVIEKQVSGGLTSYAIRFPALGRRQYQLLGYSPDWTRTRAEQELADTLADVRRGRWQPPAPPAPEQARQGAPDFHTFASEWFAAKRPELRASTATAYEGELTLHLLPFFAKHQLDEITAQEVDRYRTSRVRESERRRDAIAAGRPLLDAEGKVLRPLAARTINKTITRLGQILEDAVEYERIDRNPARGKRRRLKVPASTRAHLDRAAHITAVLEAARQLDAGARRDRRHVARRAIVATLVFGGLRISELCALRWRDVDLAAGRIRVGEAKTDAGVRFVDMLPVLRDELLAWKATTRRAASSDFVFATATGKRPSQDNLRDRVIGAAIKRANELLEDAGDVPLPDRLTPHGLRHTYASLLVALGEDPRYVMSQIGHTDPAFTLRLYTHAMRRDDGEQAALQRLVGRAPERAPTGTDAPAFGHSMGTSGDSSYQEVEHHA